MGRFWKIQRGGGSHIKNPFRGGGGIWIFSGTTHLSWIVKLFFSTDTEDN